MFRLDPLLLQSGSMVSNDTIDRTILQYTEVIQLVCNDSNDILDNIKLKKTLLGRLFRNRYSRQSSHLSQGIRNLDVLIRQQILTLYTD